MNRWRWRARAPKCAPCSEPQRRHCPCPDRQAANSLSGSQLGYAIAKGLSIVVSRLLRSCHDPKGGCQSRTKKNSGELLLAAVLRTDSFGARRAGTRNYFPLIRTWSIHWYCVAGTGAPDPP